MPLFCCREARHKKELTLEYGVSCIDNDVRPGDSLVLDEGEDLLGDILVRVSVLGKGDDSKERGGDKHRR